MWFHQNWLKFFQIWLQINMIFDSVYRFSHTESWIILKRWHLILSLVWKHQKKYSYSNGSFLYWIFRLRYVFNCTLFVLINQLHIITLSLFWIIAFVPVLNRVILKNISLVIQFKNKQNKSKLIHFHCLEEVANNFQINVWT